MARIETICRILRDVGIFMLGIAAVSMTAHYFFIRSDPQAEMQRAIYRSFTQGFEKTLAQGSK